MRSTKRFIVAAALGTLLISSAFAQTPQSATKLAIIDMQVAISKSQEGSQAAKQISDRFEPRRSALQKSQQELSDLQQQLQTQDKTLSDDARNKLLRSIDDKTRILQRDNDDANTEFQTAEQDAINEIGRKMMAIISDYAKKNGFTMILDVSNPQTPVLYADQGMDITQQVITLYDQANPAKPVVSKAAPAAPSAAPAAATAPKSPASPAAAAPKAAVPAKGD